MKIATKWDAADYLTSEEERMGHLNFTLGEGEASDVDVQLALMAIGDVARSKGMTQLARETGYTRDGLYKALSAEGNPSFALVYKVLRALGYRFQIVPADKCGENLERG